MDGQGFLAGQAPEYIGTALAVVSVILIARQQILGWPLGILWALVSAWLAFTRWHLVSDGILYVSYVPLQLYCWAIWHRYGCAKESFRASWLTRRQQMSLLIGALVAVALWGSSVKYFSEHVSWMAAPALLWQDASTTVLSYFAQFLQARKRMENWIFWFIVNVLGIHIYLYKGSVIYAAQYGFFLILGLYGWWSWRRTMREGVA